MISKVITFIANFLNNRTLKSEQNYFNEELPNIETFFSEISEILVKFTEEHNIQIDKYTYQRPTWYLRFSHPSGGEAYIQVDKNVEQMVSISGYWFLDEYDEFKKYIKNSASVLIPINQKELLHKYLTQELGTMCTWQRGEWSSISEGYKMDWGKYNKEKFYAMKNKLPIPNTKSIINKRSNVSKLVVVCSDCAYENNFNQPYLYHAGFSDQGFLYNDEGNLTLIWSSYDKTYHKFFGKIHPWMLTLESRKRLEDMLRPAPKGGRWRFENVARCLKCRNKILGPLLNNTCYLVYEGSVNTEKMDEGFSGVLKNNNL